MYRAADADERAATGSVMGSAGFASFLTGITEPIEFSFMFLAPALYAVHAVLTGLSMTVMDMLGVKLGFGFSAGLFDYALNYGKSTRPLMLIPVGLLYFALYYGIFSFVIRRFDLKTPGREPEPVGSSAAPVAAGGRGAAFAKALGGADNLSEVGACTTRLRLIVKDQSRIDEAALKALGARGIIRPSDKAVQVVLGPIADVVAVEIRDALELPATAAPAEAPAGSEAQLAPALLAALGGAANVCGASVHGNRIRVELADAADAREAELSALGVRAVAKPADGLAHLIVGPGKLNALLAR
jgi:PTS system N-acetylglucosamine-specific IIC component